MTLLHLLLELSREIPLTVVVAHFNHKLRDEAAADEAFVRAEAKRLGLRFFAGRRDVRAFAGRRGLNLEEAGRILRYKFLERAAVRSGAAKIATGHTMNDQAETVLMRMLRGTGPAGLAGIPAVAGGRIIRPLIDLTRSEILDFLASRRIIFRKDASNNDVRFLRNKIRHRLIPYLERNFERSAVRSLARLAAIAGEEDDFLENSARRLAGELTRRRPGGFRLDASRLAELPLALARRVVRVFLRGLQGDLRGIDFDDVENVLAMIDGHRLPISKDLVLERRRGAIRRWTVPAGASSFSVLWDGRGGLPIPQAGMTFEGKIVPAGPAGLPGEIRRAGAAPSPGRRSGKNNSRKRPPGFGADFARDDAAGCALDADTLSFPLIVRSRRPGDRYRPLGAPGTKKLKEIMRAKGIPEEDRAGRPVFVSDGEIAWIPGLPVAERFKLTPATKLILFIRMTPNSSSEKTRRTRGCVPRCGGDRAAPRGTCIIHE